ncbi:hypothetical protein BURPS1106B_2292 [Burkholderia pseudomallei 1106b]|uniref:Uncharacterized protein n=1 Tax=Burkholderia pseudomallei (strain 1106a) TaxID=357348 RepID=A3P9A3_BURP0|nr:hypothetical protein BURPS1106A_A2883 [Burkholderia pseudomallei 1106a]EES21112.1 hypothetical protein BURPS1106B_2292 [Burkholderia pseudomallei 1106b]
MAEHGAYRLGAFGVPFRIRCGQRGRVRPRYRKSGGAPIRRDNAIYLF